MANWCSTAVAFEGERVSELVDILDRINSYEFPQDLSLSNTWTPLILIFSGEPVANYRFENGKFKKVDTQAEYAGERSFINGDYFYEKESNRLTLYCEDAWGPAQGLYELIANKFELELSYIAEESGMGIYVNYGNYFPDKYIYDTPECTEYLEKNSELVDYLREDIKNNDKLSSYKSVFELAVKEVEKYENYEDIDLIEDVNPLQPIIVRMIEILNNDNDWYALNSFEQI